MLKRGFQWLVLSWTLLVLMACHSKTEAGLLLTMRVDQPALASGQVIIVSELVNQAGQSITFLPWNTPFDSAVTGDFLSVTQAGSDNARSPYIGMMVKRMAPTDSDYLTLAHQQSIENRLDITRAYAFCRNQHYVVDILNKNILQNNSSHDLELVPVKFDAGDAFPVCD
ncbi:hypothetical protein [Arenicella xantha]|uniref:Uncharacterized protein n=1 Tax=Arenicella xantha TaxID=644221 RepID=A0A395JL14_9GAMM|nr:hypothetical protein [Arenicella xantha]RBP51483.1 hypothetical protein DFR28_102913 [Arenicella xantha]